MHKTFYSLSVTYITLIKIPLTHMKLSLALQQNNVYETRMRCHFMSTRIAKI